MPRSFLPPFNEGTLLVTVQYNPGISLAESHRLGFIAERIVAQVPEVRSVGRRTGRAELDEHAEGVHNSELDVDLERSARSKEEVYADIRSRLSILPVSINIGQPIAHRLDHMLSGVRAQIALKIYGEDLDTLRRLAETMRERLAGVPGLVDLQVEKQVLIPQVRIHLDYERAALYGMTPAAVNQALEAMSNGRRVSQIVEGNRRFDVVMRLADQDRSTTGLADLLIATPSGHVPLRMLAEIEEGDGPNQIQRENAQRRIAVFGNGDGKRDMAAIIADIRRVVAETSWPQGYTTQLEGTFQAQEEAALRIGVLSLLSLALVFIVLYSRYNSTALVLIIMANIPLALIGSVIALYIAGQPLSIASMIGFITLAGISARNGILKISHYINLVLHEGEQFGRALIVRGSLERLTPVLDDGAGGRPCADAAAVRRRRSRPRNPASGRGDDLRRPAQRHRARHAADAAPVPGVRAQAARTPDRKVPRRRHDLGRGLLIPCNLQKGERPDDLASPDDCSRQPHADGDRRCADQGSQWRHRGEGRTTIPIEFVVRDQEIVFYVGDHDGKPMPTKGLKARAVVQDGGKTIDHRAVAGGAEPVRRQARGPAGRQGAGGVLECFRRSFAAGAVRRALATTALLSWAGSCGGPGLLPLPHSPSKTGVNALSLGEGWGEGD